MTQLPDSSPDKSLVGKGAEAQSELDTCVPVDRRGRRQAETHEKILRAALRLFAERGFHDTTVQDITEAADVGKGTFFNYFPSKEHVMTAFADLQVGKVNAALQAAQTSQEPFRTQIANLLEALLVEPSRSPALVRSMLLANLSSESVRENLAANLARGRGKLAEMFSLGQQRGEVRSDLPATELARVFQLGIFGSGLLWALHPPAPIATWYQPMFQVMWSGIQPRASERSGE
jgi:AcrR family transcriptional regulator